MVKMQNSADFAHFITIRPRPDVQTVFAFFFLLYYQPNSAEFQCQISFERQATVKKGREKESFGSFQQSLTVKCAAKNLHDAIEKFSTSAVILNRILALTKNRNISGTECSEHSKFAMRFQGNSWFRGK